MNPFTFRATSSSNTAPMPPTSGPLKFFMEDIEKTQSLSGKCVKIEAYIATIKEDRNKVKDLNVPICKQILDDAIKTLEVERDKFLAEIKDILNRTGIIDVNVSQEEMISVFQNLSPTLTNNVVQPAPANANPTATNTVVQMQQGSLGQQGSLQMQQGLGQTIQGLTQTPFQKLFQQNQQQRLLQMQQQQSLLQKQQGLGQFPV